VSEGDNVIYGIRNKIVCSLYPCNEMCEICGMPVSDDYRDENYYYIILKQDFQGFSQSEKKYKVCPICMREVYEMISDKLKEWRNL